MNRRRVIAAAVAAGCMLLLLITLAAVKLSVNPKSWPPHPRTTDLVEVDEEFVELFDPTPVAHNPAPAYTTVPEQGAVTPAEPDGNDLSDAGEAAPAPSPVVTEQPSTIAKPKKDKVDKTGPAKTTVSAEEEARRKARQGVADAFAASEKASGNTSAQGKPAEQSGSPEGNISAVDGNGSGQVGGGWIMPRYNAVPSHLTGSIELRATVNRDGNVLKVELTGGKAPAAANSALVAKCIAEVKRHRFERTDDNPPERAYARIIYNFR